MSKKPRRGRSVSPLAALRGRRKTFGIAAAVFAAAVIVAAFAGARARHARTHAAPPPLGVLLVTVGALRADAVGAYGNPGARTPWIDRLASAGVRFETARAHGVATLSSHANLLSGQYPLTHGVRGGARFPSVVPTLATLLKKRGYRTGAFVGAPLAAGYGLEAGFDVYDAPGEAGDGTDVAGPAPGRVVEAAARWLQAPGDAAVFCFVHLEEPRFPDERFAARPYHGEVAAADAALAPLLQPLFEAGKAGRTLVVFTSSHGAKREDHGNQEDALRPSEPMLRVPLVLFAPSVFGAALARTPARHVDVLPTILDFVGVEAPAGLAGVSLRTLVGQGPGAAPASYFEAPATAGEDGAPVPGVVDQGWKYWDLPAPRLYDLAADPSEARNLAATRPDEVARLRGVLEELRARPARP